MKQANQIIKWGRLKPYFDKSYQFNSIDIETIDNELFMFGCVKDGYHKYYLDKFYIALHEFMRDSMRTNRDILTWTRYDNTHLLKLILSKAKPKDIRNILLRVGKVSPIYEYKYKSFTISIENIIKDSIIFKWTDVTGRSSNLVIYNLKNLYNTDLLTTAKNYNLNYYSKLGKEYHIIDKLRFLRDKNYKRNVIKSNRLDNLVLIDIANKMLMDFKHISGKIPKSIFTNGSLARSYVLAQKRFKGSKELNFKSLFKGRYKENLLDYSMRAYHGGKIESYILGHVPKAKVIDITSAYPYAMSLLPRLTPLIFYKRGTYDLDKFFYAYIKCKIYIHDKELIHPVIVENPINKSNISPYGYLPKETVITKIEYDYLIKKGCNIEVVDYYGIKHIEGEYPYKDMIDKLFNERMKYKKSNPSLSQMYKIIINSMYGITYELKDMFVETDKGDINWAGYRAGDYFNPVIASYITAFTRTYLSDVSHNIIANGGRIFLNMTDSIIYDGDVTLDVFSNIKTLGKFEPPEIIKDVYILGAGRYEYKSVFNDKFTIKNRGFNVKVKDKSFYSMLNLSEKISLPHRTFVTSFKATTKKYPFQKMGYLIDDTYNFDPFNLGGKRIIQNYDVDLNKSYTKTLPVYLERGLLDEKYDV